jgi:hypothetical protein
VPVSYAGVYLPDATAEAAAWVEANISLRDVCEFERWAWPGKNRLGWAFHGFTPDRPIRLGSLFWPTGALRWAVASYLVADDQLTAIRAAVYSGGQYQTAPLVIDGGENPPISPAMWMLPTRPLQRIFDEQQFWLLTLVDDRYFWQVRSTKALGITEGTTTWDDLYTALTSLLRINLTWDAINPAYLVPSASLMAQYEQAPLLLDAVAYNVGQRIVRNLNGTVNAYNVLTSQSLLNNDVQIWARKWAGGEFDLTNLTPTDQPGVLPESVTITFPKVITGMTVDPAVLAVEVKLRDLGLPDFGTVVQVGNSKFYHDTLAALYPVTAGIVSNLSDLQALVDQFATDWYRYQISALDVKLDGIVPWTPEGLSDSIEWLWRQGDMSTRIQRPPFNDLVEELSHGPGSPPPPDNPPTPIQIINVIDVNLFIQNLLEFTLYFNVYNNCFVFIAFGVAYCWCVNPCAPGSGSGSHSGSASGSVGNCGNGCCGCANICDTLLLTISGVVPPLGSTNACCNNFNGTFVLEQESDLHGNPICQWTFADLNRGGVFCCTPFVISFFCDPQKGGNAYLTFCGSTFVTTQAGTQCNASFALTAAANNPTCDYSNAVITIQPHPDCPNPCEGPGGGGGGGVTTGCCPGVLVPNVLCVTLSATGAAAGYYDGMQFNITWDGSQWLSGAGLVDGHGIPIQFGLTCNPVAGKFQFDGIGSNNCSFNANPADQTALNCNPNAFLLTFGPVTVANCNGAAPGGTVSISIVKGPC